MNQTAPDVTVVVDFLVNHNAQLTRELALTKGLVATLQAEIAQLKSAQGEE